MWTVPVAVVGDGKGEHVHTGKYPVVQEAWGERANVK
jgi:hypothetical protein